MSDPNEGLVDTSVFIHALTLDESSDECRNFIVALQRGSVQARLEPVVLHEMSYSLRHYLKQYSRADLITYLRSVLTWPGVRGDIELMDETLRRWSKQPGLGFVDSYLGALAARRSCPVYTKNVRDFAGQGIAVPEPLPDGFPR